MVIFSSVFVEINLLFRPITRFIHHFIDLVRSKTDQAMVDVIYLDFSKAFGKVDHKILISMMKNARIDGPVLRWLIEFMTHRKQTVSLESAKSPPADVTLGVPQGTVLDRYFLNYD